MTLYGIFYPRVSDEDQVRGVSLDDQENAGREWFARRGVELLRVFREEGRSARSLKRRKAFREAIAFVEDRIQRRQPIDLFVFYDLSRFSRDLFDQLDVERRLKALGVRLDSVVMDLKDDAHGQFSRNMLGASNQFFSQLSGEKISRCMKETLRRGRWPWAAPLGYRNGRTEGGDKTIEVHPEKGPLVALAFERAALGDRFDEIRRRVTALGLRTRHGSKLRPQEFRKLLTNRFYYGRAASQKWGIEVQGAHPPLVTEETWSIVQRRLSRSTSPAAAPAGKQSREHPDFPLRGFVRCEACGTALTAYWATGKMGRRYPYYRCWSTSCGRVSVAGGRLESAFAGALGRIELKPEDARLIQSSMQDAWHEEQSAADKRKAAIARRIARLEGQRERLIETFAVDRAIDRAAYDKLRAKLDADLQQAHFELRDAGGFEFDVEAALNYLTPLLADTCNLWLETPPRQKPVLQRVIFPAGATYGPGGLRTPVTSALFNHLQAGDGEEKSLVEQVRFSANSLLRTIAKLAA